MEFDSLCTVIQNVSSANAPSSIEVVNETFQQNTPIVCQMSVESGGPADKMQSHVLVDNLQSTAVLKGKADEDVKEELLFEGMIELNESSINAQPTSAPEEKCEDQHSETNPITPSSDNLIEMSQTNQKKSDPENVSTVIDNKLAVKIPDLFVPNLLVPSLKNLVEGKSTLSNVNSFYLKVTEDEIFEGHFPLPSNYESLLSQLDERINCEIGTTNHNKQLSNKTKQPLKRRNVEKEANQQNKIVKLGAATSKKKDDTDPEWNPTMLNNKSSQNKSKVSSKCDKSQSKENDSASNTSASTKILVPKVPKSGDEWYDLSGGWKKRCMQRKAGSSQGSWDVYLYPPGDIKRLRSSTELMRFVKDHPEMSIDPLEVNMDLPFKVSPDGKPSVNTQKLITAIKEIKERGSISEKLFGATAAEKISAAEPLSFHLCKTKKQENIYAKAYHSESYLNSNSSEPIVERVPEPKNENNPYRKTYLSQSYMKRNRYAPVVFAKPKPVDHQRPFTRPRLFHTKRPTMGKLFILERLFARSICMPTPQKVTEWAAKLDLNRVEVMQWFRVKWRAKLQYEAEMENIRDQLDSIDPELSLSPDTLNVCRQLQKFDLKKAYDMALDPTSEIDLITEGDFVIDFETDEDDDKSPSPDEERPTFDDSIGDENIEIEYHNCSLNQIVSVL